MYSQQHYCCTCILQSLPSEAEDLVDEFPQEPPAAFPEIVRTKTFNLSPMTLEEALVQVRNLSWLAKIADHSGSWQMLGLAV